MENINHITSEWIKENSDIIDFERTSELKDVFTRIIADSMRQLLVFKDGKIFMPSPLASVYQWFDNVMEIANKQNNEQNNEEQ